MAKNFVQDGTTIEFVASAAVKSGAPVAVGEQVVVSHGDVASGQTGIGIAVGVFNLPKAAGAIEQGVKVYLKGGEITTTETGAVYAGKAWAAAASGDESVNVRLAQ